jgi:hypothetical protein
MLFTDFINQETILKGQIEAEISAIEQRCKSLSASANKKAILLRVLSELQAIQHSLLMAEKLAERVPVDVV